LVLVDLFA